MKHLRLALVLLMGLGYGMSALAADAHSTEAVKKPVAAATAKHKHVTHKAHKKQEATEKKVVHHKANKKAAHELTKVKLDKKAEHADH